MAARWTVASEHTHTHKVNSFDFSVQKPKISPCVWKGKVKERKSAAEIESSSGPLLCWNYLLQTSQIVGVISNTSVSSPLFWQIEHTEIWSPLLLLFSSNWKQSFWKRKKLNRLRNGEFFYFCPKGSARVCKNLSVDLFSSHHHHHHKRRLHSFVFIDEGVNNNDDDDDDDDDWWRSCRSAAFDDSASTVSPFPF